MARGDVKEEGTIEDSPNLLRELKGMRSRSVRRLVGVPGDAPFWVKRHGSPNTWVMWADGNERMRWGDARQIAEDIRFVTEHGHLPPSEKGSWH